ncbi:MAG: NACHT domain-containing protein [Leptolyngbyaceae cyanobacterium]
MSKCAYEWKRFWCPRSGNINLTDGGFLYDPDAELGGAYNPDLVSLEAIAGVPCLVLLGEPGIGKSQELENLKVLTEERTCASSQVLVMNLRSCTDLKRDLFRDETFTDWLKGDYHLYLFLDSLDEGLLSVPTLATGLIDELTQSKYWNHINRLHLRLACRTFVFPAILEEGLKDLWKEANFAIYELAPLRRIDVIEAAKAEGSSSDDFLKKIDQKNIVPLAIKPITLKFLLNMYRRYNGQFPPRQKLHELYLEGCKRLCEEVNESRRASDHIGNFDSNQRLIVAARIAAVTIFTNRFAVWTGIDQGDVPTEDVLLQGLCFSFEEANGSKFEITREVIKEVLDTGLFSSRGLYRMGWAHQTYAELLAAWYLTQHNLSLDQIAHLIVHFDGRVFPQLHETVAWLASIKSEVFQQVMETDPDVLLQSDLASISETYKASLIDNLLKLHDQEKLNRNYYNYARYNNLNHPNLSEQLNSFISNQNKSVDARTTAIDIAEACNLKELSVPLADIALNAQERDEVRLRAAITVSEIGSEEAKAQLKPLAVLESSNDFEDELKGCGLRAAWPNHITIEEVFNHLSSPKSSIIGGRYQKFVAEELGQDLQTEHLLFTLQWLEKQPTQKLSGYPFGHLADDIMQTAWACLDEDSQILKNFSKIVFKRLKDYQPILDTDLIGEGKEFSQLLEKHSDKRFKLVEEIVSIFVNKDEDITYFAHSDSVFISAQDFLWLIEKLKIASSKPFQQAWAKLIRAMYRESNFDHVNTILEECQENSVLESEFSDRIHALRYLLLKHNELESGKRN